MTLGMDITIAAANRPPCVPMYLTLPEMMSLRMSRRKKPKTSP